MLKTQKYRKNYINANIQLYTHILMHIPSKKKQKRQSNVYYTNQSVTYRYFIELISILINNQLTLNSFYCVVHISSS